MKNITFGNFDYVMIDSARSGYREVLVTFTANGRTIRKCIFVHEVKGKDTNYYFKEAQKQIEEGIRDGSLVKSTKKQIKKGRPHILKPAIVTLSIIVAVGAVGTGGYFLGNYFFGGNGGDVPPGPGPEPGITHTVALIAGENAKFNNDKTYLILNNVPDGTALGDIEGYQIPTSTINYTFEKWNGPVETGTYGPSFKITEDIALFATYFQGITYLKSQAINDAANELKYCIDIFDELLPDGVKEEALLPIYNKTVEVINAIEDTGDPSKIDDAKSTIESLKEFALSVIDSASYFSALSKSKKIAVFIYEHYKSSIEDLMKETNSANRFAIAKFDKVYIENIYYMLNDPEFLDDAYVHYVNTVKELSLDDPDHDLRARLWSYYGSALISGTKYFFSDPLDVKIAEIEEHFNSELSKFKEAGIKVNDTDTINWIGKTICDYEYGLIKYHTLDPTPQEEPFDSYEYFFTTQSELIDKKTNYLKGELKGEGSLIKIDLEAAILGSLANALIYDPIESGAFPKYTNFKDIVINCCNEVGNIVDGLVSDENGIIYANKLAKCFTNLTKALETYPGAHLEDSTNKDYVFGYEYLFKVISEQPTIGDVVVSDSVMQQACNLFKKAKANLVDKNASLIDVYVTLTEKANDIATLGSVGSYLLDYADLYNLGDITANLAKQQGIEQPKEFYQNVTPLLCSIVDMSVDSGFIPSSKEMMGIVVDTFKDAAGATVIFLTDLYIGAFMSANIPYKEIFDYPRAHNIVDDYIGVIVNNDIINQIVKSEDMKVYNSRPTVLEALGKMSKNFFINNTIPIFSAAISDGKDLKPSFQALEETLFNPIKSIFTGLASIKEVTYPDSVYLTCFDAYEELFTTIPKLGEGSGETFKGRLGRINQMIERLLNGSITCFVKRLDKASELKRAIEINFINVVNDSMDDETFEETIVTTLDKCQKIVELK